MDQETASAAERQRPASICPRLCVHSITSREKSRLLVPEHPIGSAESDSSEIDSLEFGLTFQAGACRGI